MASFNRAANRRTQKAKVSLPLSLRGVKIWRGNGIRLASARTAAPSRPATACGGLSTGNSSFLAQQNSYWNSRIMHCTQSVGGNNNLFCSSNNFGFRPEGYPSSPLYALLPQVNATLVPVETNPQPKSLEWMVLRDASKGLQIYGSEANAISMNSGVGDPFKRLNVKLPMSPLDASFPPIQRYLSPQFVAPLNSPREAFSPEFHVLRACVQCGSIPIELIFDNLDEVYKVNEGVFGEVYAGYFSNGLDESVYKVVPIEGTERVNNEAQKHYEEIETEIRVSQRLNILWNKLGRNYTEGFCHLYWARLLRGAYPNVLVKAWKDWNIKHKSDNDLPVFGENQLYVVFEYQHCGYDAESFLFQSAEQSHSILLQVAFALAAAESELRFEHRDLHWGNVIVLQTQERNVFFRIDGVNYKLPSSGLKSTIIDFTMARCHDVGGEAIFDDLKDDEVQFSGHTDYQFEIYRQMRRENNNNWSEFHPKTNIFWLHYLCDKFLKKGNYVDKASQTHQTHITHLQSFQNHILAFDSCTAFVKMQTNCIVNPIGSEGL